MEEKRVFDLAVSVLLAGPAAVLCLITAPFIWAETRASPLFKQTRVGRNGTSFTIMKLRTMSAGTPDGASHVVGSGTITRTGRLLRRTKLDELPQIWNVLRGEMSLVGPRPCLPQQSVLVEERRARGVLALRPGVTGLAQLAGLDMSDPVRLAEADAGYIGKWSLAKDLRILIATGTGKGAGDPAMVR